MFVFLLEYGEGTTPGVRGDANGQPFETAEAAEEAAEIYQGQRTEDDPSTIGAAEIQAFAPSP